jgi:hypothetical protein
MRREYSIAILGHARSLNDDRSSSHLALPQYLAITLCTIGVTLDVRAKSLVVVPNRTTTPFYPSKTHYGLRDEPHHRDPANDVH